MDLICYVQDGWDMQIRPAEPTRPWMDATPLQYAYRCLPLNIANAHGWEIVTPVGFFAYWKGGAGVDDVVIRPDEGMPKGAMPVSLFGNATFTIHVQGLFRTPPGWNLMVGPSPNTGKDGIHALSGIIETDWSPYSFTMNWRFTRQDLWVRFEAGEPICFLQPVMRNALERMEPKLVPLRENPDLGRQFAAWSKSRDDFHAQVAIQQPAAPTDQWQKRYYRGIDMDDQRGVPDHQAKLRLKPFVNGLPSSKPGTLLNIDASDLQKAFAGLGAAIRNGTVFDPRLLLQAGIPAMLVDDLIQSAHPDMQTTTKQIAFEEKYGHQTPFRRAQELLTDGYLQDGLRELARHKEAGGSPDDTAYLYRLCAAIDDVSAADYLAEAQNACINASNYLALAELHFWNQQWGMAYSCCQFAISLLRSNPKGYLEPTDDPRLRQPFLHDLAASAAWNLWDFEAAYGHAVEALRRAPDNPVLQQQLSLIKAKVEGGGTLDPDQIQAAAERAKPAITVEVRRNQETKVHS